MNNFFKVCLTSFEAIEKKKCFMLIHAVKSHDHHHHFACMYNGLLRNNSYKAIRSSEGGSFTLYNISIEYPNHDVM